jgi:hypothetical protein
VESALAVLVAAVKADEGDRCDDQGCEHDEGTATGNPPPRGRLRRYRRWSRRWAAGGRDRRHLRRSCQMLRL